MAAGAKRKATSQKTIGLQYAALPWRLRDGNVEILLITSRRTRRWIIPKGWPMEGCKPAVCAAREAEEEAGVSGDTGKESIGNFRYMKLMRNGAEMLCQVEVYPLKVTKERDSWDEEDARQRRWCSVTQAAAAVLEPQLKMVIRRFGARLAAEKRRKPATV